MDCVLAQAMWVLGLLPGERLPEVAATALEAGLDSQNLRILAGLTAVEIGDAPGLFELACRELGHPRPSRRDAAREYAIAISREILSGESTPREGASKIWDASIRVKDPSFHDLDTFIYAVSELQSRPADRDFFTEEIIKEAGVWASRDAAAQA